MTFMNTKIEHDRSPEVDEWIKEEAQEQELRFKKIDDEMSALKPKREKWYAEFFHRIKTTGVNIDGDDKVPVAEADIPVKPEGHEDRVVWKNGVDSD